MTPIAVLHVPHSFTEIPADLRSSLLLSENEIRRELLWMTDWYTDELFSFPADEAASIRFPVSRLVVDPERFPDDDREPMAARGMGVIYARTSDGRLLRGPPNAQLRRELIARFYEPHHLALGNAVQSALDAHARCLIVDCHSFPSVALPCDMDQAPGRPDICIGTDSFHTPDWLTASAIERFAAAGYSVTVNRPYAGALVPVAFCGRDRRVASIMIEVNRRLYMDEAAGDESPGFDDIADVVQGVVAGLLAGFR
jgi:N-formylglutamate deformylase